MNNLEVPNAVTIFCDQIRREDNGKLMFIGVYTGSMMIGAPAPQVIQICMFLQYIEPRNYSEDELRIEIISSDRSEPIHSATVLAPGPRPDVIGSDPENRLSLISPFMTFPLEIAGPTTFRVRWYCGEQVVHGGSLKIEFAAPAQAESAA